MRGHAAELTASPGGLSVRTTAASQCFHKRCVTAHRFARARSSRDFARCWCASRMPVWALVLYWSWFPLAGAGLRSEAGLWLVATTPRQPLRRDAKPQTVFVYGKASQQSMRGCIGAPKRLTNRSRKGFVPPQNRQKPRDKTRGLCIQETNRISSLRLGIPACSSVGPGLGALRRSMACPDSDWHPVRAPFRGAFGRCAR